jgi:cytochrome P450
VSDSATTLDAPLSASQARGASYLQRIDAAPADQKWPLARGFLYDEPFPFFEELRGDRPVLVLPNLTIVSRFADCALTLRRHQDFGVDLYKPKQGDYFMAQDDTADHFRDKSIMKSILDYEDLPAMRAFVARTTKEILDKARGGIDAPKALTRVVPVSLVQQFFGFNTLDAKALTDWSYWNQQDAFHNQPFDDVTPERSALITKKREESIMQLALRLGGVVLKRGLMVRFGMGGQDSISRLMRLSHSHGLKFPIKKVILNAGGLLIGSVETTSHTACNAIREILSRPDVAAEAHRLAVANDPAFDGYVWEALRLRPAFPYFFRVCHKTTEFAGGTAGAATVAPGTTVMAITQSAMVDPANVPDPTRFDPTRSQADNFTLGYGLHECLGRAIAEVMLPELVKQVLARPGLREAGPMLIESGAPEHYPLAWTA